MVAHAGAAERGDGLMAIYIPGALGIPEKGAKYICIRADGTVTNLHGDPLGVTAVEVPEHGDLIDRNAIMDGPLNLREATKYGNLTDEQQQHSYSTIMMYELADVIDDAPVIIPADKEADDGT